MKTMEEVGDWLSELQSQRRRDLVTKQMAFGNTGAMNALKWVVNTSAGEEEVQLKINELQIASGEAMGDEMASVAYSAMIAALNWVLGRD
ncbi:hypothetical protein [Homoserinimonas sp. OAct 916]|uniref:hypothetical protein n=1 Tax=Homoserinimonas sp. OAct 916 TaxID=2211450 RepID=UPI001300512E|nr:hypothetical protein [Homoserinimonas sp. OAct 916]